MRIHADPDTDPKPATLAYYFLKESWFFLQFWHDDRMIWLREAQKHVDMVDPDPQHCLEHTGTSSDSDPDQCFSSKP
jgi:hypothetical protein